MLIWIKILLKFISYKFDQATSSAKQIIFFVISFLLTGIFARGGLQERPIDWGHAMFSNNQFANQLALNPLFNFGRSVVQLNSEKNISKIIHFMDDKTALDISKKMILAPNEKFIDSLSFKRKIISPKSIEPNIVFIILESFLGNYCGFINNNNYDITPNLNKIAKEGINFSKTIASGKRSAFGLGSILCSWPVLPGLPLISSLESQKNIDTIGSLLKKINYSTYFLFGYLILQFFPFFYYLIYMSIAPYTDVIPIEFTPTYTGGIVLNFFFCPMDLSDYLHGCSQIFIISSILSSPLLI